MTLAWLRRRDPALSEKLRIYLFTERVHPLGGEEAAIVERSGLRGSRRPGELATPLSPSRSSSKPARGR